jgi:hypothetical protein
MNEFLPEDFRKEIEKEIRKKEVWLGEGKATDFERYKEETGRVKGLKQSLDIFNSVMKMHGEEEYE